MKKKSKSKTLKLKSNKNISIKSLGSTKAKKIKKPTSPDRDVYDLVKVIKEVAEEKKGENIVILDVSKLTVLSDYFIIITATTKTHTRALANYIEEKLKELNYKKISIEGIDSNSWIILDYGEIIIHIMLEEQRNYYKLESYWSNAELITNKQPKIKEKIC